MPEPYVIELDYKEAMKLYDSGSRLFHPSKGVWLELVREGEKISLRSADVNTAIRALRDDIFKPDQKG